MKPELQLTLILFLLVFVKLGRGIKNDLLLQLIQVLLLFNFVLGFFLNRNGHLFGDLYQSTSLFIFEKNILNLSAYLVSLVCADWLRKSQNLPEFFLLMVSSMLGMFLMISSGNLLIFYLSLELSSIPVAAMVNFDLLKRKSSEAAMKLILSSAFSSGVLLFGISLLYGSTGTISFSEIPARLNGNTLQVLAFILIFCAFAFKLSIVPFHLWTADVYEGAPIAATSFLSVASKGAFAFVFMGFLYKTFLPLGDIWYGMLVLLTLCTLLIGNLFALRQQNIKRFLAFSSIAQVGFILLGVSGGAPLGSPSVVYFILIYVFSNLAAFGVASVISEQTGKENIDDYNGLYKTNPFLSWVLTLALFSLAGIPPTAGFFGKLFLITAGASKGNYGFILTGALNLVISLYYYLRIVRAIFFEKNDVTPLKNIHVSVSVRFGLIICSGGVLLTGLFSWIYDYIQSLH
jgi:NADH-quinone oxidoreductase subunit N